MGASAGAMSSTIAFADGPRVDITETAVMATVSYATPSRWSARVALGAVLGGALEAAGRTHDLGVGVVAAASGGRTWTRGAWFLAGSLGVSALRTTSRETSAGAASTAVSASDLRAGVLAGRSLGRVSPYALARALGGPVMWRLDGEDLVGGDIHHYQLGAGVSLGPARGWTLVLDVAALGERGLSFGVAREL